MSVLTALFETYNTALDSNMVDQTDKLDQQTIILPVYHSSKKSSGSNDMIEVLLSEEGTFIKAEWIEKDKITIFPITENSIIRAGKVIAPHPLCDELSYLSKEIDAAKHKEYEKILEDWVSYIRNGHPNKEIESIQRYLQKGTILEDCAKSLFSNTKYQMQEDYSFLLNPGEKTEKLVRLDKTFVTFQIETESFKKANISISTNMEIHQNYINYVRDKNAKQPQEQCDISGELTYCVSRHRGLMGNAKLISISNHNETYYGRFDAGEEVIHIGFEVSQKIHLMLKYLMENGENRKQIGSSCILINWFSTDIGNKEEINLMSSISPFETMGKENKAEGNVTNEHVGCEYLESDYNEDEEFEEEEDDDAPRTLGGSSSGTINDYLTGQNRGVKTSDKFYIMILDKISNGRISVKYFRELPKSDLLERVKSWYLSTSWPIYNGAIKQVTEQTPSLFRYVDTIFGYENAQGNMECRISKLRTKTVERLLPCILDHKKFPLDLKSRMLENLCHRNSYDKSWNSVLAIGCSIFKKYQFDYENKSEVNEMLDTTNKERNYLYGRLLAIYEKLEQDALNINSFGSEEKRSTNAERLWTAYTKMPARTAQILEDKLQPYKRRLYKNHMGLAKKYDIMITNIMNSLSETTNFQLEMNKALNENFVFGYYAQIQDFYKKKDNESVNEPNNEEGSNQYDEINNENEIQISI